MSQLYGIIYCCLERTSRFIFKLGPLHLSGLQIIRVWSHSYKLLWRLCMHWECSKRGFMVESVIAFNSFSQLVSQKDFPNCGKRPENNTIVPLQALQNVPEWKSTFWNLGMPYSHRLFSALCCIFCVKQLSKSTLFRLKSWSCDLGKKCYRHRVAAKDLSDPSHFKVFQSYIIILRSYHILPSLLTCISSSKFLYFVLLHILTKHDQALSSLWLSHSCFSPLLMSSA